MAKLMCRVLGHDRMTTSSRSRVCVRCGQRETLRDFGHVTGWQEADAPAIVAKRLAPRGRR
jgi:hypothetical protein